MECRKGGRGGRRYGVKGWSVGRERRYGVKGWSVGMEGGGMG